MIFFSSVVAFKGMGASCLRLSGATTRLFSSSISESVKAAIKNNNVIVYSKTYCSYCAKAKNALSELKVDYVVVELNVRLLLRHELSPNHEISNPFTRLFRMDVILKQL